MKAYSTILFDLGGVLIDLDYNKTIEAFKSLGVKEFELKYSQANQTTVFDDYETGQISTQQFINRLLHLLELNVSPNQIVHAWNAMILDFQPEKLELLQTLRKTHRIALLSNTNDIHIQKVERKLKELTDAKLTSFFDDVFLSHEIKRRKPDPATFEYICDQLNEKPSSILFIDDSFQHIDGAKSIGMQTILHPSNNSLKDYFS